VKGVSVLILTYNEEANISDCLDSCAACDDVVVFDSLSSDGTKLLASSKGARIRERVFDNYAAQRNAALRDVRYKHEWVLMLDADERLTPALAGEIERSVAAADMEVALFRIRRKDYFLGKWIKRSSGYPTWFGRLVRIGRVRVEREINEEYAADGRVEHLQEHLLHYPFNKGVSYWFERHNRYSTMEAAAKLYMQRTPIDFRSALSRDPTLRRRALKQMLYRVPMRPYIVFLYLYVIRLGVLDGLPGLYFSRMRAAYEMLIDLKVMEAKRRRRGLAV
jgi:glycosyltransferase involved in cell wall biosynthesis